MQILQRFQHLIEDIDLMQFLEHIRPHNRVQIRLHKLKNQIKILLVPGLHYPVQPDDVIVVQLPEDGDLAVGALGVDGVAESVEYFL